MYYIYLLIYLFLYPNGEYIEYLLILLFGTHYLFVKFSKPTFSNSHLGTLSILLNVVLTRQVMPLVISLR